MYRKSPANAKGNAQQRCMFESPVKENQSPEGARRPAANCSVLLVLCQRRIGWKSQIFPTPFHLAPSFGITPSNLWKSFTVPETTLCAKKHPRHFWL